MDEADGFSKKLCETIWNAIQYTDQSVEQDFVEVYFGTGEPWDGEQNNSFMYHLSSIRNDSLVLISQNLCKDMCNDFFPRCYRFGTENLCGQSYNRSLDGLKTALRDVEDIHRKSPAKYEPIWAVLLMYGEDGKEQILYSWKDIENPLVRCTKPTVNARTGSEFSQWWDRNRSLIYILMAITAIVFIVLLVSLLTKKNAKKREQQEGTRSEAEKKSDEESLEEQVIESEEKEKKMSWIGVPGSQSPSTV